MDYQRTKDISSLFALGCLLIIDGLLIGGMGCDLLSRFGVDKYNNFLYTLPCSYTVVLLTIYTITSACFSYSAYKILLKP